MIKRLMVVLYVVLCPIVHEANGMIFCSDEAIKENCEALSAILYGGDTSKADSVENAFKKTEGVRFWDFVKQLLPDIEHMYGKSAINECNQAETKCMGSFQEALKVFRLEDYTAHKWTLLYSFNDVFSLIMSDIETFSNLEGGENSFLCEWIRKGVDSVRIGSIAAANNVLNEMRSELNEDVFRDVVRFLGSDDHYLDFFYELRANWWIAKKYLYHVPVVQNVKSFFSTEMS